MSYPKKLLRLRPTQGIVSDVPAHEVGAEFYTTGQNVIFRQGFASRILGSRTAYGDMPLAVRHLLFTRINGTGYWLVFGPGNTADDEVYALETANQHLISPVLTPGADSADWSSALLNGIPIVTNGFDELMYWSGNPSNPLAILPGWTATETAKSIATLRYHIFAFDIDGPAGHFESLVKWSHAAEPGTVPSTWTPATNNEAGSAELSDAPGPILCGVPLRDALMVYKRSATYVFQYVGGNQKFSNRKVFPNVGALTRKSVCDVNGQHLIVTAGDIVLTDGNSVRSIGESRMREYLFNQIDTTYYENLFTIYNRAKNEVLIAFPESGSPFCSKALVYDVSKDAFGVRDLADVTCAALGAVDDTAESEVIDDDGGVIDDDDSPINAAVLSSATESLVLGSDLQLTLEDTFDATTLEASVGKYDLHFGDPERVKFVKRLHILAKSGSGSLLVRVGSRMSPSDDISWSAEVTLDEPDQIVNTFAQGRYISVELRSTGSSIWTVTGINIEAELRGYH